MTEPWYERIKAHLRNEHLPCHSEWADCVPEMSKFRDLEDFWQHTQAGYALWWALYNANNDNSNKVVKIYECLPPETLLYHRSLISPQTTALANLIRMEWPTPPQIYLNAERMAHATETRRTDTSPACLKT